VLSRRLISAAVIISVMVSLVVLDHWLGRPTVWGAPGLVISLVTALACVVAGGELVQLWQRGGCPSVRLPATLAGVICMSVGACWPVLRPLFPGLPADGLGLFGGTVCGLFVALVVLALLTMRETGSGAARTDGLARSALAVCWLLLLVGFLAPHRLLHEHNGSGACAVLAILVTVKMSDAWAYFFGKLWGRTKMAPELSPNKTVEGGLGSVLGAVFGALIVFWLVAPYVAGDRFAQSFAWIIGYGVTLAVAGMIGDLFESMLKRDSGCKDSSAWFPGLGGVMDIIDSIAFAAPASWLYWVLTGAA
jgi:phosphatidate cytidylyltransferase